MACNTEPDSRYVIAIGAAALDEYYTADTWPSEGGKAMGDYKEDMIGGSLCICRIRRPYISGGHTEKQQQKDGYDCQ